MFKQESNTTFNNSLFSSPKIGDMHETTKRLYEAALVLKRTEGQSAIARLLNTSPQTVKNWETRGVSKQGMIDAQRLIGCRATWVETGDGEMEDGSTAQFFVTGTFPEDRLSPSSNTTAGELTAESTGNVIAIHPDDELPDGMISVMEYQVSFSAGNGHTPNFELIEEREPATYRLSWFQRERINPNHVKRFKVTGDSMEPFLYSGDSVLVNLSESDPTRINDGKVYAIRYGNELRIKRLYRRLDGTLTLRSENPDYKDEDVPPELAEEHITIIGRVRDKSGAGGL